MRELNAIYGLPDDVVYKEVVVIGNGPSGICTSYQLAGHWPVLRQDATSHPEAMLEARLKDSPVGRPLPLQPLNDLAGDLEGRSQNPIPLLVDCLTNPGADMGMDLPSMLEWKYFPEKKIDHVVLGRGKAGGLWHTLDSSVVTLSPSRWMALPGQPSLPGLQPQQRAPVSTVATYYQQYVKQFGLQKFFRNNTMVTSIKPIKWSAKLGTPIGNAASAAWCVCGYDSAKKESFRYVCSRVILATGASDRPNAIKENGKASSVYGAIRTSPSFQTALDALSLEAKEGRKCLPILVIGSGLSAADAILRARARGLPVAHAYRSPSAALRALPPSLYPEYHQVHQMMKDGVNGKHLLYTALPDHITIDDSHNEKVIFQYDEEDLQNVITPKVVQLLNTRTNKVVSLEISFCVILIGSKPDLHFLPDDFNTSFLTFDMDNESLKPDMFAKSNRKIPAFNLDVEKQPSRIFPHPTDLCIKCSYNARNFQERLVFLKTQWHNLKCIVGHGLQKTKQDIKTIKDKCEVPEITSSKESLNGHCQEVVDKNESESDKAEMYPDFQGTGIGLGIHPNKAIDSRTNPFYIDKVTHELQNAPKGMYALGPLAGDNFVRFIPGGALAIVSSIWNERKSDNDDEGCSV